MGNRIGLFVSVVLASAALAMTSSVAAPAADECIAKPNGPAPAGKHWYYRTNREIKKKCWYLADEGEKTVPVAQAKKQPITEALVEEADDSDAQPATSNARAELIETPKAGQTVATIPQPQLTQPQVTQPQIAQSQPETSPAASESVAPGNWTMASRWPDTSNAVSVESPPMAGAPAPEPAPTPATESRAAPLVLAAAAAEPAVQPTVGISNSDNYGFVFAGAILAVIAGGAIVMFLGRRNQVHVPLEETMSHVRPRLDASSFARPSAGRPVGAAAMPSQGELRDEIEELLEMSRRPGARTRA